jgi:hypothetical protein
VRDSISRTIACLVAFSAAATVVAAVDEPAKAWRFLDIQDKANAELNADQGNYEGNNLKEVPRGEQTLAEARFKVGEKFIHIRGDKEPDLPEKVEGIKVDSAFEKLHILHSTGHGEGMGMEEDGKEVGAYVVHYADKTEARIPIIYGQDLRDWWDWPERPDVTRAKVAWKGDNPAATQNQRKVRLYAVVWPNPHPDKTVATIDYVSGNTLCDPFLIALSLENPK